MGPQALGWLFVTERIYGGFPASAIFHAGPARPDLTSLPAASIQLPGSSVDRDPGASSRLPLESARAGRSAQRAQSAVYRFHVEGVRRELARIRQPQPLQPRSEEHTSELQSR